MLSYVLPQNYQIIPFLFIHMKQDKHSSIVHSPNATPLSFQRLTPPPEARLQSKNTCFTANKTNDKQNSYRSMAYEQADDSDYDFNISEDLLLSEKVLTHKRVVEISRCPTHLKNQDIICVVERVRICPHCALFGTHKDHTFKSEAQLLQQLLAQQSKLNDLSRDQNRLRSQSLNDLWRRLQFDCRTKEKELLDKLNGEFNKLMKKIEAARKDIQASITQRTQSILQTIHQEQQSQKWARPTFNEWAEQGRQIISNLMEQFDSDQFGRWYGNFDAFDWSQGQLIVSGYKQKIEKIKESISKSIEQMKASLNHSINNLNSSPSINSQVQVNSQLGTSITSLEDLQKNCSMIKIQSKEEIVQVRKFRHSQCLETIHQPMRTSLAFTNKAHRMSAQNFVKKSNNSQSKKKENYPQTPTMTTNNTLQRQTSKNNLETSILAPKPKMKMVTSPILKPKPDPMSVVNEYQKDESIKCLNLGDCNLSQDSLVYFLQRVTKVRPLLEINLEKNNIGAGKLTRILPYFINCIKINLSYCGLTEACFDSLLRAKTLKRLQECNLSGNQVNIKKNKHKVQQLRKLGINIIYLS